MPRRGKLDLEKIRASLNTPCPHCGHSITPEERTHVDTEHLECPQCKKRFIPGKPESPQIRLSQNTLVLKSASRDAIFHRRFRKKACCPQPADFSWCSRKGLPFLRPRPQSYCARMDCDKLSRFWGT